MGLPEVDCACAWLRGRLPAWPGSAVPAGAAAVTLTRELLPWNEHGREVQLILFHLGIASFPHTHGNVVIDWLKVGNKLKNSYVKIR